MTADNSKVIANAVQSKKSKAKWNTELFVARAKLRHGDKYDYSKAISTYAKDYVEIVCNKHGGFTQRSDVHLKGSGCPECSENKKHTKKAFVEKARSVHGFKYDYSKSVYVNNKTKIEIICEKHGSFFQSPQTHFAGRGCSLCANEKISEMQYLGQSGFLAKAKKKHGDRYDYSKVKYTHCKSEIIIICRKHGEYTQKPYLHLNGNHCQACATESKIEKSRDTTEDFIKKAKSIHGERYVYDCVEYQTVMHAVKIKCIEHGYFWQKPKDHTMGAGCKKCASQLIGFNRSKYIEQSKKHDGIANLYVIECFNDKERFLKIGITMTRVNQRYSTFAYKYRILHQIQGEAGYIWDLEKKIHSLMRGVSYKPLIYFGGYTECFAELPREVDRLLRKLNKSDQLQLIA